MFFFLAEAQRRKVWRMFFSRKDAEAQSLEEVFFLAEISRRGASAEIQKGLSAKDCYAIFILLVYLIYWQAK